MCGERKTKQAQKQQGVQQSITITQPHNRRLDNGLLFKYSEEGIVFIQVNHWKNITIT